MFWKPRISGVGWNQLPVIFLQISHFSLVFAVTAAFDFKFELKTCHISVLSVVAACTISTPSLFVILTSPFSTARSLNCPVLVSLFFCDLWPMNQGWGSMSEERRERWGKWLFPARLHYARVGNGQKCLCVCTCSCCFSIIRASVDQSAAVGHMTLIVFKPKQSWSWRRVEREEESPWCCSSTCAGYPENLTNVSQRVHHLWLFASVLCFQFIFMGGLMRNHRTGSSAARSYYAEQHDWDLRG